MRWLLLLLVACGGVPGEDFATAECAALCAEGVDCTDVRCVEADRYVIEVLEASGPVEVVLARGEAREVVLAGEAPAASEPVVFRPGVEVEVFGCSVLASELVTLAEWDCAEGGRAQLRAVRE